MDISISDDSDNFNSNEKKPSNCDTKNNMNISISDDSSIDKEKLECTICKK